MQPPPPAASPPLSRLDELLEQRARRAVSFDALPPSVRRRLVDAVNQRPGAAPVLHAYATGPAFGDAFDGLPLGLIPFAAVPILTIPVAVAARYFTGQTGTAPLALLAVPLVWSMLELQLLRERLRQLPVRPGAYVLAGQQVRVDVRGKVTFSRPFGTAVSGTALVTRHQTNWMRGNVVARTEVHHSKDLVLAWGDGAKVTLPARSQQEAGALFERIRAAAARLRDADLACDTATVQALDPFHECDATGVWERSPPVMEPPLWPPRRVARDRAKTLAAAVIPLLFVLAHDAWARWRRSWPVDPAPTPAVVVARPPPRAAARPAATDAGGVRPAGLREEPGLSRTYSEWVCDAGRHRFEGIALSDLPLVVRGDCVMELREATLRSYAGIVVSVGGEGSLTLEACRVEQGVAGTTLLAGGRATVSVRGGSLRGGATAVHAADRARVSLAGVTAEGSERAIDAIERARVRVEGSTLRGAASARNRARIEDGGGNTGLAR
ncbi:MAG: hypothetical protein U0324_26280 [Polyangiales bacterium]